MTNELTSAKLAEIASEYFKDIFDSMGFKDEPENELLQFAATKGDFLFRHDFYMAEWSDLFKVDMGHHRLESLKGEFILSLQKMTISANALNPKPLN